VNGVEIRKIDKGRDLKAFIRFPWRVYRDDPNWVPPLIREVKEKLDKRKHPFFEHAEADCFMAFRGGEPTGRIAAVLDRNHNSVHSEKTSFFGMYESLNDPETARALLETAEAWGRERGMDVLRGPMNLSMNDECAFLLEGFDSPPSVLMPYNPPYYIELMETCGLAKAKDLYAFRMSRDPEIVARLDEIVKQAKAQVPFTFRRGDRSKLAEEARKIALVYNSGWEKNWGFVPWTQAEMDFMVRKFVKLADLDLVVFAEHEGRAAGFALGLPNYNELLAKMNGRLFPFGIFKFLAGRNKIKSMRAVVFGLMPEFRKTGLSYLLYSELAKAALRRGYEWGELSWQLEDNEAIKRFSASIGARVYKKYRIFEKSIASRGG
jgi:GNAT superfamily N-acetyltransferase